MSQADRRNGVEDGVDVGDEVAEPSAGPDPHLLDDKVIGRLTLAILGLVALFLVGVISALVLGMLSPPKAPRTLLERNLAIYGKQVDGGKADATTWATYISALIDAKQLSKAQTVLNDALAAKPAGKSAILLQQARLEYARKDYAASVKAAEAARLEAEKEQAKKLADLKQKGIKEKPINVLPPSWLPAVHQKADALVQLGEYAKAVEAYTLYLTNSATDSTILVSRGEAESKLGDKAAAERDFREALEYIPDYQPALDALEEMGATQK